VVAGPARGREDVARAKAAAAATTATTAATPEPEHWMGTARCPVCLENWDMNELDTVLVCCCKEVCVSCAEKLVSAGLPCPLCRTPRPESHDQALAMLRRHVENDNPVAISHLGNCYAKGHLGLVPSHKKAARLSQRAADLGDVFAMNNLGVLYKLGQGVKLDKKKAVKYYRMAADRGHAIAQCNLGQCLRLGDGVAQDDAEAFRFCKLAADQGFTDAEHNLGCMYVNGDGVARDVAEADRWFERAAAKGCEGARAMLARLRAET
jgi:TPR repeat protein